MKRLSTILLLLLTVLEFSYLSGSQSSTVPVSLPIHGRLVFPNTMGSQMFLTDTYTGDTAVIVSHSDGGLVSDPVWSPDGDRIAYYHGRGAASTIFNVTTMTSQEITSFPGREEPFFPKGWTANGNKIFYYNAVLGAPGVGTHTLDLLDLTSSSLTTLLSYNESDILTEVPLPANASEFRFSSFQQVKPNPVHDEWIALQLRGTNPNEIVSGEFSGPHEASVSVNVLWNFVSGQMLSLDNLLSNPISSSNPLVWSPDGNYLIVVSPNESGRITNIIHFYNSGSNWLLELVDSALASQIVGHWLGVSDLLIASEREDTSNDLVFHIAQIINSTWYSTEFLRFPNGVFPGISSEDWHLTASEDEKHALSCLFDQAMPTRLSIGTRARVNFTDGTPLRLRTEPEFESTEITQMPEGTEFDVIGGPACVNSDFYYRFWQLELDDGTVGWAAEANNTDYFIEPVVVDSEETATLATETTTPTGISAIAWSPDGSMIAVGRETDYCVEDSNVYTIEILDPFSRQVVQTLAGSTCDITAIDWSPDGTKLAAASLDDIGLRVWDVQSGELLALAQRGGQGVTSVRWRPDGLELAVGTVSNGIAIIDPITGETTGSPRIGGTSIDWNPDGSKLMSGGIYDNDVYIADMTTGQQIMVLSAHAEPIYSVDWSPDSGKIASASGDDTLRVWDATTGENLFTMNVPRIVYVRWNPDSQTIAIASYDNVAQIWDATKGELLDTFSYPRRVYAVDWSPDGTKLAYSGSRIDGQDGTLEIATLSQLATPAPETTP